jgi:hypothetical protein
MRKLISGAVGGIATLLTLATAVHASGYDYTDYYTDLAAASAASSSLGAAGLVATLITCCIPIAWLIFSVVVAIVVYKDAEKNKVENGVIWALLTFFFNIIGLLVYYLAIKPEAMKKNAGGSTSTPSETK